MYLLPMKKLCSYKLFFIRGRVYIMNNIKEREQKNVLVLAPHMDDELIGCGGSILKHKEAGRNISIIFFTDGSHFINDKNMSREFCLKRKKEANTVCEFVGVTPYYLDIPDRTLSYNSETLEQVVNILHKCQPDIIYLPHRNEGDKEHRIVAEIFNEAYWLANDTYQLKYQKQMNIAKVILEYEVWTPIVNPTYYEDISDFIEKKCNAISIYKSQKKFFDYAYSIKGLNQYRGGMFHVPYAEAFIIKKGETIDF